MKNRNIPFGYQYENGIVAIHPTEAAIVKRLVSDYLNGQSLLNIAVAFNAEQIEYMPGIIGWNKARIMRIIEDKRYLGESGYPALIDADTFNQLQDIKSSRNNQKNTNRQADIFQICVPVLCPECGTEMHRRHDSRCKCTERWTCRNKECRTLIEITDADLLGQITAILNYLILHPETIKDVEAPAIEPSMEAQRLENEIGRSLDTSDFDKESLRKKLMECVSLKYKDIPSVYTAKRLKADFEKSSPLSDFSASLFGKAVKAIHLKRDGSIDLSLINGQRIGKE